ncbi:CRISPR-associated endoribonuclease Cas6 [Desulfotomaculum arcticum]|uniref:CRISPR-associated endoribonuclease Cas6 n=1 Tax=Desulfotruncus arcticus DSM 17038 TaxID=1121424 RepID=A0A1I2UF29_9FIRM|nr:CRISPR-associated endoribonuclease Cas6 [Desulfotruncus arcticus]SFG73281.1 CRISPR-associated endoribonuclease Cas6 [Desulfotomaculum arcticum] [Desulfotruncus arcticus DSM 17038]
MRIKIELETECQELPIDYRRKFISYVKSAFENYNQDLYATLYEMGSSPKSLCFSIYFVPEVEIRKDGITLHSKRFIAWFTTPDILMGVHLINAIMARRNKWFPLADSDNKLRTRSIINVQEQSINTNAVHFKILSPIVIRDHYNGATEKDWYYTFEDSNFEKIWKRNLKAELQNKFNRDVSSDIDGLQIKPINLRKTVVKNYGIYIPCTIGNFILAGERYLLDYLYKAGIGSKRSLGFGCLDIV